MLPKHTFAFFAITVYAVIGLLVYQDYGISWDEEYQHSYGKAVYGHVLGGGTELHAHNSRYHGPVFQFALYSAERMVGLEDPKQVFALRHLLTFLFSVVGCWFFYRLLLMLRYGPHWAAVGMLFLICSPRIFAHSFFNSKDAVFMYAFIISMYSMLRLLRRPDWRTAMWHGIICGLLVDIRILGVFAPMITMLLLVWQSVSDGQGLKRCIIPLSMFGFVLPVTIYMFWPTLWHDPVWELGHALQKMSAYPWDDPVLFEGSFSLPQELPWHYLPKWILITTPVIISLSVAVGSLIWLTDHRVAARLKAIPFLWVFLPFALILWKGATLYDGWRHVFFIYPALLVLAVSGAERLFAGRARPEWLRWIPVALLSVPVLFMVRNHPHQQVYFNPLAIRNAGQNYEMDYWGLSYRQALESLAAHVPEGPLTIAVANAPGFYNHWMLPLAQRNRIHYTSVDSAAYFISNFRFPGEHHAFTDGSGLYADPMEIIEVGGNPAVGVFRLRRSNPAPPPAQGER